MPGRRVPPTERQVEILRAIAEHGTIRAAARALGLSRYTVDSHLDHLRARTGLRHLPQLIAWAGNQGWLAGLFDEETVTPQPSTGPGSRRSEGSGPESAPGDPGAPLE